MMADHDFGEILHPRHCRVSASPDGSQLALTFDTQDRTPVTIMLPMAGALGLQRNLAQTIYFITKMTRAAAAQKPAAGAQAGTGAAAPDTVPSPEAANTADAPVTTH